MTDLTKLSDDGFLRAVFDAGSDCFNRGGNPLILIAPYEAELRRRFAALTARITELEQELQEARERVEWLDNACRGHDLKAEAVEKALDEAYESCRLMEDRVNRLVDQSGRVVALENALRERPHVIRNDDGLWLHFGDFAAVSVEAICRARGPITGKLIREFCERAALVVRAEETT